MIEFVIPLNLPVRAVTTTATTADPPDWVARERVRRATRLEEPATVVEEIPEPPPPPLLQEPSAMELELESLRQQRDLFDHAVTQFRQATEQFQKQLDGMVHEFQLATVEVAHAIAVKLNFDSLEDHRFPVENLVHEVVSRLDTHLNAVVSLHPDDLAYIEQLPAIEGSDGRQSVQFLADSTLLRGDCKARAGDISVIYDLKHQVEEIRRQLLSTVHGHAEH